MNCEQNQGLAMAPESLCGTLVKISDMSDQGMQARVERMDDAVINQTV